MKPIRYFDEHIIINIFGIVIRIKYARKHTCPEVTEWGCSERTHISGVMTENSIIPREKMPKLIVSLTSFPERINTVAKTIKTLLTQTMKPDMVVLWLAPEQFPEREKNLPPELLELCKYGLTIDWYKDIRSYKKIIPALKKYPEAAIITVDDDIYYAPDTVETLYESYLAHPDEIQAHRSEWISINDKYSATDGSHIIVQSGGKELAKDKHRGEASFRLRLTGCAGVLYPPHSLYKDVTNEEIISKTIPTHDDVWLWAMAVLAGTKVRLVKGYSESISSVENSQQFGLCKINNKTAGMSVLQAYDVILKQYPQILDVLKKS